MGAACGWACGAVLGTLIDGSGFDADWLDLDDTVRGCCGAGVDAGGVVGAERQFDITAVHVEHACRRGGVVM